MDVLLRKIYNKSDMIKGCVNRMCTADSSDELLEMYAFLNLHASSLYSLIRERLYDQEADDE